MNSRFDNPFIYSDDNKRYHTYNYYLKHRFGKKVYKIPLNVDLGCPNRDGTKGVGGCLFCSAKRSGDFAGDPREDILTQYNDMRGKIKNKLDNGLCIAYFQAGSNTYADIETLRKMFYTALSFDDLAGLSIATRADCLDEEKADMLAEIAEKTYLTVELGLQTIHDETAFKMNRCHSYGDFLKGFRLLKDRGINVCVHIIDGLPNEDRKMMIDTAKAVGELGVHGVKIHLLHILKNTGLAEMYERGEFRALEMGEYVNIVCDQLEVLPKETVIQRITGDGARNELVAPLWSLRKKVVMNEIDKEMGRRDSWQGKLLLVNN